MKKKKLALLMTVLLLFALCTVSFAAVPAYHYVQATEDCWLWSEIGSYEGSFAVAKKGDVFAFTGESAQDSSGVLWYEAEDFGLRWWISSETSTLTTQEQAVKNHPTYFDGLMWGVGEQGGAIQDEKSGEWRNLYGSNDCNMLIGWFIEFFPSPYISAADIKVPEAVTCSWTDTIHPRGDLSDEKLWHFVLDDNTVCSYQQDASCPADIPELHEFQNVYRIYLPDDPSLEGRQSVSYHCGNETITFTFDLVNNGGYFGRGTGWSVENVEMSQ